MGSTVTTRLPRGFWPWSPEVVVSPAGIIDVQKAELTDSGDLMVELRALSAGDATIQFYDYVDRERFPDGRIPRIPNRTWRLGIRVVGGAA
jgi:hypothetical protein